MTTAHSKVATDRDLLLALLDTLGVRYDDPRPPADEAPEWARRQIGRWLSARMDLHGQCPACGAASVPLPESGETWVCPICKTASVVWEDCEQRRFLVLR